MKYYTDTNEWVVIEDNRARVGITKKAISEIGQVVHLSFSLNGKIKRGEEAVILESSKAAIEHISPLSGKILSVNSALEKNTDLLNSDAEGKGWLYEIEFSDPKELEELITK